MSGLRAAGGSINRRWARRGHERGARPQTEGGVADARVAVIVAVTEKADEEEVAATMGGLGAEEMTMGRTAAARAAVVVYAVCAGRPVEGRPMHAGGDP